MEDMEELIAWISGNPIDAIITVVIFGLFLYILDAYATNKLTRKEKEWENRRDEWEQDQLKNYQKMLAETAKQKESQLSEVKNQLETVELQLVSCNDRMEQRVSEAVQDVTDASNKKHQENVDLLNAQQIELNTQQKEINDLQNEVSSLKLNIKHEQDLRKNAEKDRELALIAQAKAEAKAEERQNVIVMLRDLLSNSLAKIPTTTTNNNKDAKSLETSENEKNSEIAPEKDASKNVS